MTLATGVAKQVRYKVESVFGTAPAASGAQLLRRVSSTLALKKETYQSAEIRSDYQVADMRHGMRRVEGSLEGELSPGTYKDFLAAALRRDWTAVSAMTSLSITVAGSGPTYTLTDGANNFLTDGVKVGMIVRLTAGAFNAANLNKNLLVTAVTATIVTVRPLNGDALLAEGPIASATLSAPGKVNYVPATGHTNDSFSIEHWHSDISRSHLFRGCKVNDVGFQYQPGQMAKLSLSFIGQDVTRAGAEYFTTPGAETTTGVMSPVSGLVYVNGAVAGSLTGLSFGIKGGLEAAQVIGSNVMPDVFAGRVMVDGQFSAYFEDGALHDLFDNESEIAILYALTTGTADAADFVSFAMTRIKLGGADDGDGEKGLPLTLPFTALLNTAGGASLANEATTLWMQDSQA
jgi:hypothetical protein